MKLKTSITSLIYRKALRIHSTRDDTTSGEIVNLMSVDVQKIVDLMPLLNTIWSGPLQIIAAIYLLINTLGYSALAGVLVMFLLIPINGFIAVRMKNAQMKQMKKKDERVKKMNEILQGIKIIKLYAWESSFFSKLISSIRVEEIKLLKLSSKYFGFMMLTISSTTFFISLFTFIVYVVSDPENHILDSEKIFVSISLFNILRLKRINKFLASEELEEGILVRSNSHDHQAICIHPSSSFSWKGSSESLFKDISMDVNRGNLIAIIGPVGSGKSSLISALLGEMLFTSKGTNPVEIHGSVAYTPQNAWMQNVSVKDNILFGRKFNKNWYDEVLKACSLESDMEVFPSGDSTEIGEKGINLSGGQKQRISLARAVYSQSDIYFLDDPLAAVDSHVAKHLFEEVIGSNGLLRGKTRILVTHNLSFLHLVDEIYFLKDGEITEKGTYKELMEKNCDFSELISNHANNKITNQSDSEKVMEKINEEGTKQPIETNFKIYDEETLHTGQVGIRVYCDGLLCLAFSLVGCKKQHRYILPFGNLCGLLDASRILHGTLFQCIIKTPMSFFDTTPLGRILNRFGQDIEVLDTKMSFLHLWIHDCLSSSRQLKRLSSVATSPIYSHFGETLSGINTVRAYSLEKAFYSEFERRLDEYQKRNFPVIMADRWLGIRINLIGNFIIFASALFSVLSRDTITPGQLGLNVSSSLAITSILSWVIRMYSDLENNIVAVERIKEYSNKESEAPWELEEDLKLNSSWPLKGEITIKNLSLKYRKDLDWVLRDINVHISPGDKMITIDGVDIKKMGLHTLRSKLTIIPQDPTLFSGTLRLNLDPFGLFKDMELIESLKHAYLQDFLKEDGLDKLICLARALLRKNKVLIMDEATAAVDSETDKLIQKAIKDNFRDSTVLTIAHRLQTVLDYSKIIVIDSGCIIEYDSPKNLLSDSSSTFYKMCLNSGINQ
ncbi:ABCC1 [Lepeophtheirus salmonis]|uniref:ABCC1 n=1 Tax=Lepeophtheirus salmonis TaxID=72036 RepID=A0A7R8GYS8_LEPSM|nr:ABCC1 [Lepeophtheirus salmonis]CAF2752223.1 ABCC1 [Lepeophtheirus salmonis]